MDRNKLCKFYFHLGLPYKHILSFLAEGHGICISLRTLKRILRGEGLFRRKFHTDILDAALFIQEKITSIGNQQGYRWMHLQCLHQGITIPRDNVQFLMQLLDPIGVELRLRKRLRRRRYFSKGPDFLWHVDAYDKLKRYGLCISGCIDGFSRHLIWLNVYTTSSDPRVIAGYYMEAVDSRKGCPSLMRGDNGTENGHVAQMQNFMTRNNTFIFGRSTANQRIEMFWFFLRKQCCQYWMDALGVLADEGLFNESFFDRNLIQFCCMALLQGDLDDMIRVWNAHNIRPTKNQNSPHGRPIVMYMLPSSYDTRSPSSCTCYLPLTTLAVTCMT
ncbi:uncharacterized protein LOC110449483 [Mizuhopecten yessoensis]|uniref:Integrase core domain-containing protein n=1 Tax=Mizuhopecten yessoensis TaxID=6573 RepID=A0A210QR43_MIZYE|nr:uncharacterized protein LOC110449483 [Mizuhopecten yessoensis]OWF51202.1 hypothetical protein KP79_PYT12979 [Mizuhopecten yessoensis]